MSDTATLGWLRFAPASAKRALVAASLGWMFDGFDIMVYSMVLTAVIADFGISKTTGGVQSGNRLIEQRVAVDDLVRAPTRMLPVTVMNRSQRR